MVLGRTLTLFFLLFAGAFTLTYIAGMTSYFNKDRISKMLKFTGMSAVALLIAGREIPAGIVAVSPGDVAEALLGSRAAG